jgi:hypothetical protein
MVGVPAPRAIRIPISCVCRETVQAIALNTPDRHQHHADAGKHAEQDQAESRRRKRELLQEAFEAGQRERDVAVHRPDLPPHGIQLSHRIADGPHQQAALERAGHCIRNEHFRHRRVLDAAILHIGNHADDFEERPTNAQRSRWLCGKA